MCVCLQTHPTTKLRYFGEGDPRAALVVPHLDPRIHFALVRKPRIPLPHFLPLFANKRPTL